MTECDIRGNFTKKSNAEWTDDCLICIKRGQEWIKGEILQLDQMHPSMFSNDVKQKNYYNNYETEWIIYNRLKKMWPPFIQRYELFKRSWRDPWKKYENNCM